MTRTEPGQVVPDAILRRRLATPYAIDTLVESATETYTLVGRKSVLAQIQIEMAYDEPSGNMRLNFNHDIHTVNLEGKPVTPIRSVIVFTATSKMSCPSFSLPAGPIREGGTCMASGFEASTMVRPSRGDRPGGSRQDPRGNHFVCDLCYATAGNYFYPNVAIAQAARMAWCQRLLEVDPTGTSLGIQLANAIETTARKAHYDDLSERLGHELGVWSNRQIWVQGKIKGRKGTQNISVEPTKLPARTGFSNTNAYFESKNPPEGTVVGFFRIHDSGDLNVGPKEAMWLGYLNAWAHVARTLPYVQFWVPVRTWTAPKMARALELANQIPNFVIRASPLFVNGTVPESVKLPRSGVHRKGTLQTGHMPCPVTPLDKSSCAEEGCRACWIDRTLIPSYVEH